MLMFPDPAYPDSFYYVDVARAIAAGHGLNIDFVWIFAEVGNHLPNPAVLPIPSNAHWLPLDSFLQAPFISLLGPTALASAIPGILIGALVAPLTWLIARDAGCRPIVGIARASCRPSRAPRRSSWASPRTSRSSIRWSRRRSGSRRAGSRAINARSRSQACWPAWQHSRATTASCSAPRSGWCGWPIDCARGAPGAALDRGHGRTIGRRSRSSPASAAFALFMLVMGPWWLRQLEVFGSISPTSSNGAALWIRTIQEWNSITADPTLQRFLAQGWGPIIASRWAGFVDALGNFAIFIGSVVLVPFLIIGIISRRHSKDFGPWFVYTFMAFAGATILYPLHVPGGAFIHTAIGLAPHAAILSVEGTSCWSAGSRGSGGSGMRRPRARCSWRAWSRSSSRPQSSCTGRPGRLETAAAPRMRSPRR